jgi:hypothetical protein
MRALLLCSYGDAIGKIAFFAANFRFEIKPNAALFGGIQHTGGKKWVQGSRSRCAAPAENARESLLTAFVARGIIFSSRTLWHSNR